MKVFQAVHDEIVVIIFSKQFEPFWLILNRWLASILLRFYEELLGLRGKCCSLYERHTLTPLQSSFVTSFRRRVDTAPFLEFNISLNLEHDSRPNVTTHAWLLHQSGGGKQKIHARLVVSLKVTPWGLQKSPIKLDFPNATLYSWDPECTNLISWLIQSPVWGLSQRSDVVSLRTRFKPRYCLPNPAVGLLAFL